MIVQPHGGFFNPATSPVDRGALSTGMARYDRDGLTEEFLAPQAAEVAEPIRISVEGPPGFVFDLPHGPSLQWAVSRAGEIASAVATRYRILWQQEGGRSLVIERSWEPEMLSAAEREYVRDYLVATVRAASDPSWVWSGPELPRTRPALMGLMFSENGNELWVLRPVGRQRPLPSDECDSNPLAHGGRPGEPCWPLGWRADVYGRDGRLLGTVTPHESIKSRQEGFARIVLRAFVIGDENVFAESETETGTPYVAEYRRR